MNVLIFGGQSKRHREWVREVASHIKTDGKVIFHDYHHWDTGEENANIPVEILAAGQLAKELGEYVIVAKSIGSVIATLGIRDGVFKPRSCLFLGMPLRVVKQYIPQFGEALPFLPPTIFVQNEADPLGGSGELRSYLDQNSPEDFRVYTSPGDTHDYVDFETINRLIARLN